MTKCLSGVIRGAAPASPIASSPHLLEFLDGPATSARSRMDEEMRDTRQMIESSLADHQRCFERLAAVVDTIENVSRILTKALANGGQVLVCGNGGSAADAEHFAAGSDHSKPGSVTVCSGDDGNFAVLSWFTNGRGVEHE